MNIRSFRRKLEREGWRQGKEAYHFRRRGSAEELLRAAFEECLKNALEEIRGQAERGAGRPFMSWGVIEGENGQSFKVTIEGEPPPIPGLPSLN